MSFVSATKVRRIDGYDYNVPMDWSNAATYIFAKKYCRSHRHEFRETDFRDVFTRLVKSWTDASHFQKTLFFDMWKQKVSPNSPQYFNGGIYEAYKALGGDVGLWHRIKSKTTGKYMFLPVYTTFQYPQLHACFIQPIDDSLESISNLLNSEARLFSRGSGTGTNFSNLRGVGEGLSPGGTSSGLISFLEVFDKQAGAIKSGGTTRRAAKMVVLDVDHPEIFEFIDWKSKEERKAKVLINAGYDSFWEGEAYKTVSGQNSNNSVRVSDKFMDALDKDGLWHLWNRANSSKLDGKQTVSKEVSAKYLWERLCRAAWECADPGVQFSDTINKWNTTPNSGEIRASNPCSEHLRLDNSACNLASINLIKFLNDKGEFDIKEFINVVERWVVVLDKTIDIAGYPTQDIAITTHKFRDIGLGFCGLGALLMRMGVAYDSDEARDIASGIAALMTAVAYKTSASIANKIGAYSEFKYNKEEHLNVVEMHHKACEDNFSLHGGGKHAELVDMLNRLALGTYESAIGHGNIRGFRNAQVTVIAPTGTIGLIMDCETTGIEPLLALSTTKTLAGGGVIEQTSESAAVAQKVLGLKEIDKSHPVFHTALGDNPIHWQGHVKMIKCIQPFISGGISKTVNLPEDTTVEKIDEIYKSAYTWGIKCISVYRDKCKQQPLTESFKSCGEGEGCSL